MSKKSKKARILELLAAGNSIKDIAQTVRAKPDYVYFVRWQESKKEEAQKVVQKKLPNLIKQRYEKAVKEANQYVARIGNKPITVEQMRKDVAGIVDLVNSPPHYMQGGIETIDFIEAKKLGYNLGNVVKYITRSDHKGNTLLDLEKAEWYLNREINRLKKRA